MQLLGAVGPLVVELRLNGVYLVDFLPLYKFREKPTVFLGIRKEQLLQKIHGLLCQGLALPGEAVIHQAQVEPGGLPVPRPA